jgi:hypothetical protein
MAATEQQKFNLQLRTAMIKFDQMVELLSINAGKK